MKQKIVIKIQMSSERSKSKALKIAAESQGVESVALEGSEKSRVVVIGDKVDSVRLTSSLRNKVGDAEIISITEVKPAPTSREKEREREREKERERERRDRERERERMKKEEAAKKLKRELEAAKKVKPAQTRENEKEKERARARERKKKEEAKKQAEAKETKILINLLRVKLAM